MAWNITRNFVYALASMILSFLAIQVVGDGQVGIFSFGFSTLGQQMFIIAYFGICPFQITDGADRYSFGDYLEHRNITCIMTLAAGAVFLTPIHGVGRYPANKCTILILFVIYKIIDGYADVYESKFQRQRSLYLTGKPSFFRTLFSASVFLVTLAMFEHLLFSCLAAVTIQAAGIALFNLDVTHTSPPVDQNKGERKTGRLFKNTLLLLISAFLDFCVSSTVKYAIDARMNDAALGYFNLIFMPTFVICTATNFVVRPLLTKLIDLWIGRDYDCSKRELTRIGAIILGLTALVVRATTVLGEWVLPVMEMILGSGYGGRLAGCYGAFIIIVLEGGFHVLANLMYYVSVIMRRQKAIFAVCLATAAATAVSSGFLISKFGINEAAGCCLLLMIGLVIGPDLYTAGAYQSEKKKSAGNGGSNT